MSPDHPQQRGSGRGCGDAIAPGAACVLLRHDLPDGSSHVDWLLESRPASSDADTDARDLITFRLAARVDQLAEAEVMQADRIDDHRRLFLDYEGEVSDGRGRVTRLACGTILNVAPAQAEQAFALVIRWTGAELPAVVQRLRIERGRGGDGGGGWIVRCESRKISAQ